MLRNFKVKSCVGVECVMCLLQGSQGEPLGACAGRAVSVNRAGYESAARDIAVTCLGVWFRQGKERQGSQGQTSGLLKLEQTCHTSPCEVGSLPFTGCFKKSFTTSTAYKF
jgi:hypothetical protein